MISIICFQLFHFVSGVTKSVTAQALYINQLGLFCFELFLKNKGYEYETIL